MSETGSRLQRKTNWWGAFVIGLAAPILVIGLDPPAIQALGAAAIPLLAGATAIGVVLCIFVAELAAVMPERSGGVPSYTTASFQPIGDEAARHVGGLAAWSYWLGWFPVAPINMILAAAYITQLFGLPTGKNVLPFGAIGAPIAIGSIVISFIGIAGMFIPCYLGIKLGAAAATVLGIVSMVPLTLLVLIPGIKPSSMHFHNLAGFHYAGGVHGSLELIFAWLFVMTWSVLGMEGAACYIGECANPSRDAKIAMTAEGLYGFFIFVMTAVALVLVLGQAKNADPLTIFTTYIKAITGSAGSWVQWIIGIPLICALLMSMLNAIMGCSRSLYQSSEDGMMPRFLTHLNKHGAPDQAMAFTAVASMIIVLFGTPLRIYIFSNVGYLFAILLVFYAYFLHRTSQPDMVRPVRLPDGARWVALVLAIFLTVLWAYGGWNSPAIVVGAKDPSLFILGLVAIALYFPMYAWRKYSDRRRGPGGPVVVDVRGAGAQAGVPGGVATPEPVTVAHRLES